MFADDIKNFPQQFSWEPQIENTGDLKKLEKAVILGMGGSHLAADVLRTWTPYAERIIIHSDYGLPPLAEDDLKKSLVVAVSHSGNTEEVLGGFNEAIKKNLAVAAVASGGKLIELARHNTKPYIIIPDLNIQPRLATGYHFRAILKIMGENAALEETKTLAQTLQPQALEQEGRRIAERINGRIPIIASSTKKAAVAQNWKVAFNETAKIPAMVSAIPESNHNELAGFLGWFAGQELSKKFIFIFLEDGYDHPRNQKRMALTADLYQKAGLAVEKIKLAGENHWHKIFSALLLANWASYRLAELRGDNPEETNAIEKFKQMMAE